MRRLLAGSTAFLSFTGTILVLPVYAAPAPEPEPVATSTEEVPMGSVDDPAPEADVQEGTTDPVSGVSGNAPTLTVSATDVDDFSLVGVTWAFDPAVTDTVVQVRVRDASGAWGEWTEVGSEDAEQAPDADTEGRVRGGTAPLWTGPATAVEAELVTRSGAQPTDVQLDLVDPGDSAADASLGTPDIQDTADAAMAMPPVYSRAQWGADESIMGWTPQYAGTIRAATLHHTADTNNYTADQVPAMMRSIYRYHAVSRGWGDIGYNAIVDKFGRLWEGRYGGLSRPVVGAHAGGFNTGTFGVSMLGTYETVAVPQAVVESVSAITAWKFSLHGVDPRGTTVLTSGGGGTARYAAGTRVTLPTVFGHRDVGTTSCPGAQGYARLGDIRNRVAALMVDDPYEKITERYADPAVRAALGAPVGGRQQAAGVTWQVYERGRLYTSADTGAFLVYGSILERYLAAGGPAVLGAPTTDELGTPDGVGRYNHFTRGASVYWSPSTGAQAVWGGIRESWAARRWEAGPLGYPVGPEKQVAGGAHQQFQGGTLVYSAAGGVHALTGEIRNRWRAAGAAAAGLFPSTEETTTPDGVGSYVHFTIGASIYRSNRTSAQLVWGGIRQSWAAHRWEAGPLGYPVSGETAAKGGVVQEFENGVVAWSAAGGGHPITGRMLTRWEALGGPSSGLMPRGGKVNGRDGSGMHQVFTGERALVWSTAGGNQQVVGGNLAEWLRTGAGDGPLGYPLGGETYGRTASVQEFQDGTIVWSPAGGSHGLHGPIRERWLSAGGIGAGLLPKTSEQATPGASGRYTTFTNGSAIYWSQASGAQLLWGGILEKWRALGAQRSALGFPTTGEYRLAGGRGNGVSFQGGVVYWSAETGAHEVRGSINVAYQQAGGATSRLGLPTSDEYDVPGGRRSDFQGGYISWTATGGAETHLR
ncbi:N-acetylmuramoyl-L-alanine amidase [Geodermatophilus sp. SYSU D00703]